MCCPQQCNLRMLQPHQPQSLRQQSSKLFVVKDFYQHQRLKTSFHWSDREVFFFDAIQGRSFGCIL